MKTFLTFEVSQTSDKPREGEPLWRQVDWRIVADADHAAERDAAEQYADSGFARIGTLYATICVNNRQGEQYSNVMHVTVVHYWVLTQVTKAVDPADWFADSSYIDLADVIDVDPKTIALKQTAREGVDWNVDGGAVDIGYSGDKDRGGVPAGPPATGISTAEWGGDVAPDGTDRPVVMEDDQDHPAT